MSLYDTKKDIACLYMTLRRILHVLYDTKKDIACLRYLHVFKTLRGYCMSLYDTKKDIACLYMTLRRILHVFI